jgi:hypothetical protein
MSDLEQQQQERFLAWLASTTVDSDDIARFLYFEWAWCKKVRPKAENIPVTATLEESSAVIDSVPTKKIRVLLLLGGFKLLYPK